MLAIYDPRGAFSSTLSKAASTSGGRAAAVIACLSCAWGSFPDSGQARDRAGCLASSGLSPSFPEVPCASWTCVSGQSRDRTGDLRIFSPSLYQLSYLSNGLSGQFKAIGSGNQPVAQKGDGTSNLTGPVPFLGRGLKSFAAVPSTHDNRSGPI